MLRGEFCVWIIRSRPRVYLVDELLYFSRDTSDMPPDITNKKGRIELGYIVDDGESEHLDYSAKFPW